MTAFDRLFAVMIKPWVFMMYVALMVVSFLYIDEPLARYFHGLNLYTNLPFLRWLTHLGLGALYLGPLLALALFFRYVRRNKTWEMRFWFLWFCVVIPSVICVVLKSLLGRARPVLLFDSNLYGFYGWHTKAAYWSFPSGHTSTIMGFVFGLCVLFPRYCYAFILVGLSVVISRVLLTNHYLSDVMAASYLALVEVGLFVHWLRRKQWILKGVSGCQVRV